MQLPAVIVGPRRCGFTGVKRIMASRPAMGFLPAMDVLPDLRSLKYHGDRQNLERNGIAFGDFIRGRKASAWPTELCPKAICP